MTDETTAHSARRGDRHRRGGRSLVKLDVPMPKLGAHPRALLAAEVALALVVVLIAGDLAFSWGRVHPGVTVEGVAVGGMSRSDAASELGRELGPRLKLPVTIVYRSKRWTVQPTRVQAGFDAQAAAERAYAVGRGEGLWSRIAQRSGAWFGRASLPASATLDGAKVDGLVSELRKTVDVPPVDAAVRVEGTEVTRTAAKAGVALHARRLSGQLETAFVSRQRIVRLVVGFAPVTITDEDAQLAYEDAKRMVDGDVGLTYGEKSWTVPAEKVGRWISFRPVPWSANATSSAVASFPAEASGTTQSSAPATPAPAGGRMMLSAFISADEVSATVVPLVKGVGKPAKDARFEVAGKKVTVIPGQVGIGVDARSLAARLDAGLRAAGGRTFEVTLAETQPKLTTEQAQGMGIKELISSYSTDYDSGNRPRVNNIHTLAKSLDGKLVPPGGEFSFNGAVGERTAEKGYREAPAIVNGKLVPQLGGGICQIGTTFFNTVFFSGLPILERTNHSFYISHYPKGRDATVSWGGPDLRWKNDTSSWVLIHTSFDSGSVTIALYGTDPGYKVTYETGPFTNLVPHKVVQEKDPALPIGKTVVSDAGVDGRRVVVVRTVGLNGKTVRTDKFTSVYRPKDEIVKVGTLPSTTPTSTPATPTP